MAQLILFAAFVGVIYFLLGNPFSSCSSSCRRSPTNAMAHCQRRHQTGNSIRPVSQHAPAWWSPNYHQIEVWLSPRPGSYLSAITDDTNLSLHSDCISASLRPSRGGHLAGLLRTVRVPQTYLKRHRTLGMLGICLYQRRFY